jgi:hypothetical protein
MSDFRLNLRSKLIKDLKTSLTDGNHYLFLANITNWANNGTDTAPVITDTINDDMKIYSEMISAHKLTDVQYALKKSPYVSGTIYSTYSSNKTNEFSNFYVTRESGTTIYVYICIENNNNGVSTVEPISTTARSLTHTADNYVWKLILIFTKTNDTTDYYAVGTNSASQTTTSIGAIEGIKIKKKGKSFPYIINESLNNNNALILQELDTNNDLVLKVDPSTMNISSTSSIYSEYALYVLNASTNAIEKMYELDGASYTGGTTLTVSVCNANTVTSDVNKRYALLPRIRAIGNGTGLMYNPVMNTDKTIKRIRLLTTGSGYSELNLILDTYEFETIFNYTFSSFNYIKDLNITELFIYKDLTATSTPYTKLPIDLTIGSTAGNGANAYTSNEIRQFGIISKSGYGQNDGDANPNSFTTSTSNDLSACDVLKTYKGTSASKTFFNILTTELTNDDYVCQFNALGTSISAYGKVVSITYDTTNATTVKEPKITVKTLYGNFEISSSRSLYKYTINSTGDIVTTNTNILVSGIDASQITKYLGKILYIDNINPIKMVANQKAEFKIIISL